MFLYLALMASICGFSACILRIDFMLESFSGNSTMLMTIVTTTMDHPKLCTKVIVEPVDDQEQRLGQDRQPAEIHHLLQLGVDALQQVEILGAHEHREMVDGAVGNRHARSAVSGFLVACGVATVSAKVTCLHAGVAFRQEDGGEVLVLHAGEREVAR